MAFVGVDFLSSALFAVSGGLKFNAVVAHFALRWGKFSIQKATRPMQQTNDFGLLDRLHRLPYFARVDGAQLTVLANQATPHHFAAGELLFGEGEPSAGLWVLESGSVKAHKFSAEGQEYVLRIFGAGDTFNDLAALDGGPNAATTTALTDGAARVIASATIAAALEADHRFALAVIKGLASRARHLVGQIEDLALRPVTARLARFLLEQATDPTLAHPAVTRALIANYLATTPESVSRSLRVLEQCGAIRFDRHRIVIVKEELLRELAMV